MIEMENTTKNNKRSKERVFMISKGRSVKSRRRKKRERVFENIQADSSCTNLIAGSSDSDSEERTFSMG